MNPDVAPTPTTESGDHYYLGANFEIPEVLLDIFSGALWEVGTVGFQYSDPDSKGMIHILAFFPRGTAPGSVIERLIPWLKLSEEVKYSATSWQKLEDANWNAIWRSSYAPIDVGGRLIVAPSWSRKRFPGRTVVKIKPEMAFGTGSHESTRLCLDALLASDLAGARVADVGTGSGILAITAVRLGAVHVDACDPDLEGLKNAVHNARLNKVTKQIRFHGGTVNELPAEAAYDCMVGNLILEILREDLTAMAQRLRPGGVLHISGILSGQVAALQEAIIAAGLTQSAAREKNEWVQLTLQKPA